MIKEYFKIAFDDNDNDNDDDDDNDDDNVHSETLTMYTLLLICTFLYLLVKENKIQKMYTMR